MKHMVILFFIIITTTFTLSLNIEAGSQVQKVFKCSGKKIEMGDTTYSVLKKCGEPAFKEKLSNKGCAKEEKWHYDCFGRGNVEELIFKKGILIERIRGEATQGTHSCN